MSAIQSHFGASSNATSPPGVACNASHSKGTKKPKVTRGDRLEHQRTSVDLILGVLASRGGSSLSTMAIVMEDRITEFRPCRLSARSRDQARLSLLRSSRLSLYQEQLGQCREPGQMENHDRTLKELATPDVVYQPWCIQYPQLEPAQTYELKRRPPQASQGIPRGLFHDEAAGNPRRLHQDEGVPILPGWSRKGLAISATGTLQHLGRYEADLPRNFFPASKTATIRKEICGIRQHTGETLHEYWECFNKLCATCPHHQISEQLLIQYFYEGLSMMDRSMIDAASGGALMDKTPVAARHLISNMASNTQQFGIRGPNPSRPVNEIGAASNQRLENQLTELTSLVRQLAVSQHHPAMETTVCGICTSVEHPTNLCPTLQETESVQAESVGAVGGFQYEKQPYQTQQFDNQPYGKQPFWPRCSSESRILAKCTLWSSWLPTTDITISSTTLPATTKKNPYSRQLTITRRFNEAAGNK
ncbi:hypothetical protein CR513_08367, partial [Mucuna pruriens]